MSSTGDFLTRIIQTKRARLERAQAEGSFAELHAAAHEARRQAAKHALRAALTRREQYNIIAEIKRASPSKGVLRAELEPGAVARAYQEGGAAAVSVLTEEDYFRGSLADLRAVRAACKLPVLRKDFIFDEWQVYEAAAAGADALLLIVAALADDQLARLRRLTEDELGMDALVEVHTLAELRRAETSGAQIIGVNNRDLHSFAVSLDTSIELIAARRTDALFISESGLRAARDLANLHERGFSGFLIGETLMRADDPAATLRALLATTETSTAAGLQSKP